MARHGRTVLRGGGIMGDLMRDFDWPATPLGPVGSWPSPLLTLVDVMLAAEQPMFVAWGPDLTMLYNNGYVALLGSKHPAALGAPFSRVWDEIRDDLQPLIDQVMAGNPVHMDHIALRIQREGREPEAHFAFSYTPVRDDHDVVQGFFCPCTETTDQILAERRQAFRLALEDEIRFDQDPKTIVATSVRALGRHLGANRVGYGEMQADDRTALLVSGFEDDVAPNSGAVQIDAFGKSIADRLRDGLTAFSADIRTEAHANPDAWAGIETRAFVCVPLVRDGRLKALLYVNQREPRRWSQEDVSLVESVAARIWDAVERVQADARVRAGEATLRAVLDTLPVGVIIAEASGRIIGHNGRAEAILGHGVMPARAGEGVPRWVGFHEDGRAVAPAEWPLIKVVRNGEPLSELEVDYQRGDGRRAWIGFAGAPMRDAEGQLVGGVVVVSDIDARKRSEQLLALARDAAEDANVAKSTFIANMSHELRTPLSAIIGYSEMLREEMEDGAVVEDLAPDVKKIEGNARHLLGLINDVLDLSKVESGKMEVFIEDFDIETFVGEVAETVQTLVGKKGNRLEVALAPGLGEMRSDLTKLRQILLNLLGNAAKFTEAGAITLAASRERAPAGHETVVFRVSDTGIGMTPDQLEKLFQRFQQADSSTTRRFGGTGLGLSLTKAFADLLGGTVEVASRHEQGSSFTVRLPASYVAPLGQDEAGEHEAAGSGDPAADQARDLVLVIDDDADQRALMTRFLHREGFRARTAADGREGLALARDLRPRAILLDVMMPGLDGWSVLSALKADPDLSDVPVVMVTFVDQRGLAASLGASDYVLKPVRWDRFKAVMDRFRPAAGTALVIDDDADTRERLHAFLEQDGWTVIEAENGEIGLERVATARPEVILLDLTMPVMDGFTFLQRLRAQAECDDIPVVVLTARDLTRDDRRRLGGANQILHKGDLSLRAVAERLHRLSVEARSMRHGG